MCIVCKWENSEEKIDTTITILDCSECTNLTRLPDLTGFINLRELICSDCPNLKELPSLPSSLTKLYCLNCNIKELPDLHELNALVDLNCCGCRGLKKIPSLPTSLKVLACAGTGIRKLPSLPVFLRNLFCVYCSDLTFMPKLPVHTKLLCDNCPWLPIKNRHYDTNIKKLILLQKNLRKLTFKRRLVQKHYLKKFLYTDLVKMVLSF